MLVVTTNDLPGYKIEAVLGEVMGLSVRTANWASNFSAGLRAISGGEVPEYTQLVYDTRNQVIERMWQQCVQRGGNAIVAMRYDTGDIAQTFSEVCAYGTAVVVRPLTSDEEGATTQSMVQTTVQDQPVA